jgi:hypothetical protein
LVLPSTVTSRLRREIRLLTDVEMAGAGLGAFCSALGGVGTFWVVVAAGEVLALTVVWCTDDAT